MDPSSPRLESRGARPDAETSEKIYLIKQVPALRATYQVRLLSFLAAQRGKKLVLRVPPACQFDDALQELLQARPDAVEREDLA
jgi:hypothetical protein